MGGRSDSDRNDDSTHVEQEERVGFRRVRRWCIPPALLRDPQAPEVLEGIGILREWQSTAGLVLWQAFCDVLLWAEVPAEVHGDLFAPEAFDRRLLALASAGLDPSIRSELESIARVLRSDGLSEASTVWGACLRVSSWAAARGEAPVTALSYAKAAATVLPIDPDAALEVSRRALEYGHLAFAEAWARRTVSLARRAPDAWAKYAEALFIIGEVCARTGLQESARRFYMKAVRASRRHGVRDVSAYAHHGLMRQALQAGDLDRAQRYAGAAARAFGRTLPFAHPSFYHDVAELRIRQGHVPRGVIENLRKILPTRRTIADRTRTMNLIVRAAALSDNKSVLAEAWLDAVDAVQSLGETKEAAAFLLELAHATASALEEKRADQLAQRAVAIGRRIGDADLVQAAHAFLHRPRLSASGMGTNDE